MKIMITASFSFAKEMLDTKKELEILGHSVLLASDTEHYFNNPQKKMDPEEELSHSMQLDSLKECFSKIAESNAILVLNYPKKGIKGYLGTSVLMEMGLAYYLGKQIFLLNDMDKSMSYAVEAQLCKPVVLNGDLKKIA